MVAGFVCVVLGVWIYDGLCAWIDDVKTDRLLLRLSLPKKETPALRREVIVKNPLKAK